MVRMSKVQKRKQRRHELLKDSYYSSNHTGYMLSLLTFMMLFEKNY